MVLMCGFTDKHPMCGWGLSLDSIILILGILEAILKVFVKKFGTRTSAVKNWLTIYFYIIKYIKYILNTSQLSCIEVNQAIKAWLFI